MPSAEEDFWYQTHPSPMGRVPQAKNFPTLPIPILKLCAVGY